MPTEWCPDKYAATGASYHSLHGAENVYRYPLYDEISLGMESPETPRLTISTRRDIIRYSQCQLVNNIREDCGQSARKLLSDDIDLVGIFRSPSPRGELNMGDLELER